MITEQSLPIELRSRFAVDSLVGLRELLFVRWKNSDVDGAHEIAWFLEDLITSADHPTQDRTILDVVNAIGPEHGELCDLLGKASRKWFLYHKSEREAANLQLE